MFFYQAYGLKIKSTLELPELYSYQTLNADIAIETGKLDNPPLVTDNIEHCYQMTADGLYLYWKEVGTFLIRAGKEIIIEPSSLANQSRLRLFILGAAIASILYQRGLFVLHGSGVEIDNQAVIFLGNKGWGKSTIAAALNYKGYSLIGDDVIAIDLSGKVPQVLPAFPQLKLWPDALEALKIESNKVPQLVSHLEKRDLKINQNFCNQSLPLKQIYVLGLNSNLEIKTLDSSEIIKYLLLNSYMARFGDEVLKTNRKSDFLKITKVANQISINRLLRPSNLDLLPKTVELIENHLLSK